MRKLKLQMQVSLDGFIAGENGEMDWMTWDWDDQLKDYIGQLTETIDCIVLGRVLAEGFIPHWAGVAANSDDPENSSGKMFTHTPKVVFSRTLTDSPWENTRIATDNLVTEINGLKNLPGKDIMAYGGGKMVSSLIRENLIDEYHLCMNPVILGKGIPVFQEVADRLNLKLSGSYPFDCGIVVLRYQRQES